MLDPNRDEAAYWNWEATFWDEYVAGTGAPEGDVQFLVEEAQKSGAPVLEIGCGTGRGLIPIAESGIVVVGLDFSPIMLAKAREKISRLDAEMRSRIELVEGDMRSFSLGRRFTLAMITYAFFFLTTPEDQRQALTCIRDHLIEDGRLILINPDPKPDVIAAHLGPLGMALQKFEEFSVPDTRQRMVIWRRREYDLERQLSKSDYLYEEVDEEGKVLQKTYKTLTARYTYRYEMQYLLELSGYKIEALYRDFKRGPFRPGEFQIWVARKG